MELKVSSNVALKPSGRHNQGTISEGTAVYNHIHETFYEQPVSLGD